MIYMNQSRGASGKKKGQSPFLFSSPFSSCASRWSEDKLRGDVLSLGSRSFSQRSKFYKELSNCPRGKTTDPKAARSEASQSQGDPQAALSLGASSFANERRTLSSAARLHGSRTPQRSLKELFMPEQSARALIFLGFEKRGQ